MVKNWHALYQILRFPIEVLFFAFLLLGLGSLLVNPVYGIASYFDNDVLMLVGEILQRTGSFLVVNFPLLFLFRLVSRRTGSSVTVIAAFAGFVVFNVTTMFLVRSDLPATAYSSILGLSITRSSVSTLNTGTHYPLQTGIVGAGCVGFLTMFSYRQARKRRETGAVSFLSREASCVILTVVLSLLAGIVFAFGWPYVVKAVNQTVSFISRDTASPSNLILYGVLDRFLGALNLGTLIRQPFWYTVNGGSWISTAGASIAGDVNIWTAQIEANALSGASGRFITPYYILNLFAIPGMVWAMHSLQTNRKERRRTRRICVIVTVVSLLSGCLLPVELFLFFLCPMLFFIHLGLTGMLYGVLAGLQVYLGYRSAETSTITALPGTLPEFLSYLNVPGLRRTLILIVIIGAVMFFVYYFVTRFYFQNLAVGFFNVPERQKIVAETIKALGGTENIRAADCSITEVTVSLYDPDLIDVESLEKLGSFRVYEFRDGFNLCFGNASVMVRNGIRQALRDTIRDPSDEAG